MKIVIIKYNAGNILSVKHAVKRLGYDALITDNHEEIRSADRVIFPGVGEAGTTMSHLKKKGLDTLIPQLKQPVLGICLGLQLMCSHSEEGNTPCLGIFPVKVKRFEGSQKIPHMGWNSLTAMKGHIFQGLPADPYVYFVHSYYAELSDDANAVCNYILPFSAALNKDNFFATQFHPEKSGDIGRQILYNFIKP
jgi:glutamine amidotransferase